MTGSSFVEAGQPAGRRLVNTNNNYRKCEENCVENNAIFRNKPFADSWVYNNTRKFNRIVVIVAPIFLALCFIVSMIGVLFLVTSFFLGYKFNVITTFINECNLLTILLIYFLIGTHLLTTGITGVLGLGKHQWFLLVHFLLGVGALLTVGSAYYFEPEYEPYIFDDIEMTMWCSLSHNRANYNSEGWDYIQYHMQCCGVNGYTDWCTHKKTQAITKVFNNNKSLSLKCHNVSDSNYIKKSSKRHNASTEDVIQLSAQNNLSDSIVNASELPQEFYNKISSTFEDVQNNSIRNSLERHILEEEYTVVSCFVPATCCVVDMAKQFRPHANENCMKKNTGTNFYNRGCYLPILQLMQHFVNSFMAIIKCVLSVMIFDLMIAAFLIFN